MDSTETKQTSGCPIENRELKKKLDLDTEYYYVYEIYERTIKIMKQIALMGYSHLAYLQATCSPRDEAEERLYALSEEMVTRKEANIQAIEMAINYLSGYGTNQRKKHGLEVLNEMLENTKEHGKML